MPFWVVALVALSTLSLFLSALNLFFWRIDRQRGAPLWLAVWLAASVLFAAGRARQYLPADHATYDAAARVVLTAAYALAWIGYELANSFIGYRPRRAERLIVFAVPAAAALLMWATDLIATRQIVIRTLVLGGSFHGLNTGPLYLPANLLLIAIALIGPVRLLRAAGPNKAENRLMALGYAAVILSAILDVVGIRLNLGWPRFMDFSYLPMGVFFSYIQMKRISRLYRYMDTTVRERTTALAQANDVLRAEVSERKQAQEALEISEGLYRMLFDANPHPGWVYDLETLAFLLVNDAAVAQYQYSREEFLHMTLEDIRPPEELPGLHRFLADQGEELRWSGPWKHRRKDGSLMDVEVLSHRLLFNGRPARLAMANDITDRIKAETALLESENKYRTLVENAWDGIAIIQNGRVGYVNTRLAEMRGEAISDILDQTFDTYVHPDERARVLNLYARRLAGEDVPATYETALQRRDGQKVPAELTVGPIVFQGKPAEIIIVRDISERRQTEETLQRQLREMTVLSTVATAGSEATYVDGLIERVTQVVAGMLYPDNCGIILADEQAHAWHPHPSYRGVPPELMATTYPCTEGISGKAISENRVICVNDVLLEPAYREGTPGIRSEMAVPIVVNGKVFGCINAESRRPNAFGEHDERLMSTIAESMTTAIEKIRLLQAEKRRREEAEILYNTTRDLVVERDLTKLLQIIVERAVAMLDASGAGVDLCEPENRLVRCAVSYNLGRDYTGTTIRYGEGVSGRVAETGQPMFIEDYRAWSGRHTEFGGDPPFISVLGVPMRWQGRTIGALDVLDNTRVRPFDAEDVRMLELFANQATMAVENARLFKETSQRAQEAAALADVSRSISETLDLGITLGRIATFAKDLLHARTSAVYIPNPATSQLCAIAALGPYAEEIKNDPVNLGEGILGNIAVNRVGEIVNNVDRDPRSVHIAGTEQLPVEHLMGVPVFNKDQLTGLIATWRVGHGQEFNAAEFDFLTRLAGQVGVAIENARLFEGTRLRLREIEGLHVVSTALRAARSLDEALPILLEQLMSLLNAAGASLEMLNPANGEIVITLAKGAWAWTTGQHAPVGDGVTGQVISTVQPYVATDVVADGKTMRPDLFSGVPAVACVPVIARHRPIGVLWIGRQAPILQEELNLLSAVGEMVGNAIQRMLLNEETERRANEFEALYRSANTLAVPWDLDTVLKAVVTQARDLLHSSGSDVYLYDPVHQDLRVAVEIGEVSYLGTRLELDEGMAGRVFRYQQPLIVDNYRIWPGRSLKYDDGSLGAAVEVPITFAGEQIGVLAAYETANSSRKYTEADSRLLSLFATQAAGAIRTARLLAELRSASHDLALAYDTTLEGWAKALELRDKETLGHSRRVTDLTLRLARRLGMAERDLTHIRRGVLLHDIGKMGITDQLLHKPAALTEDEWVEMRKHPRYAYDLLQPIDYLRPALDIPYCHHERWDGSGYPRGLKGKQIPLAARIFAVVDVYDTLSYDRPYRTAWPRSKVLDYLRQQAGQLFDPEVTQAFLDLLHEGKKTRRRPRALA